MGNGVKETALVVQAEPVLDSVSLLPQRQLDRFAFEPSNWEQALRTAEALSRGGLLPDSLKTPAAIVTVIMQGRELGLTTMQSIRGVHVINGVPRMAAQLMVALVLNSGKAEYFDLVDSSDRSCTFVTKRVGSKRETPMTWTIDQAAKAKLTGKQTWQQYPSAMLRARCSAELARAVYPDILFGIYDPDEISDESPRRRRSAYTEARTIVAEARATNQAEEAARSAATSANSPPRSPPEAAPPSRAVPKADEAQQPVPDANQAPEEAQSEPANGNGAHSTTSSETKAAQVFVSISDFWKRLRASGIDQQVVLTETVEMFGAQPGQIAPELRGVYVVIKEAGLSISDVARDIMDNFGIEDMHAASIESWVMYASLIVGPGGAA